MLTLTPEEESEVKKRLARILGYFDELRKLELEGVEPMYTVEFDKPYYREDVVETASPEDIIRVVPKTKERYVKAPRIA
jgi:aspartyl/glutamyl-tRNA(Asn/Gln) amidotransferase C subunit